MIRRSDSLIEKLDRIFSQYIRRRDSDYAGFVQCCTCGKFVFWKKSDAGHYHNRRHMGIRWDETNVHAQCRTCNRFDEGEKDLYKEFIICKYGQETIDLLLMKKKLGIKWHKFELEAMIALYKQEVKRQKKDYAIPE